MLAERAGVGDACTAVLVPAGERPAGTLFSERCFFRAMVFSIWKNPAWMRQLFHGYIAPPGSQVLARWDGWGQPQWGLRILRSDEANSIHPLVSLERRAIAREKTNSGTRLRLAFAGVQANAKRKQHKSALTEPAGGLE